jgi:hypothetical protein
MSGQANFYYRVHFGGTPTRAERGGFLNPWDAQTAALDLINGSGALTAEDVLEVYVEGYDQPLLREGAVLIGWHLGFSRRELVEAFKRPGTRLEWCAPQRIRGDGGRESPILATTSVRH